MNKSSTLDTQQCRTCLSFNLENENASVNNIITFLTAYCHISVSENDELPTKICSTCLDKAYKAFEFIKLCENSDAILRNELSNKYVDQNEYISDTEYIFPNENIDELCIENLNFENFEFENYDICDSLSNTNSPQTEFSEKKSETDNNTCLKCGKSEVKYNYITLIFCDIFIGKVFKSHSRLKIHSSVHNRKGSHLCQICGKQFTFPENLSRHYRIHTGDKKYKCKVCSKSFVQSGELKSHMISHTTEKTYLCNYCGNKFARKLSLKVHIRRIHSMKFETFLCHLCGKGFKDQRDLGQHKLIHAQERKHICSICNKAFNRKSNLLAHIQIHMSVKPHTCDLCDKGFTQKHALNKHIQRVHNVTITPIT